MPAANRYTNSEFLIAVRNKGHIPPSQTPFDDGSLLDLATDELNTALLRQIRTSRENYYLKYVDNALNSTNTYNIPSRAVGGALVDIHIVNGTQVYPVSRSETNEQFSTVSSPTGYWSFQVIGNQIVILPIVTVGVIRLWYLRRPNVMVPVSECSQVTAVDQANGILSFASGTIPSTFTTSSPMDSIQDQPHFDWNFIDQTPTAVTTTSVTFTSLPTDVDGSALIKPGDWLALAGQTPVPQIPVEFTPLLIQRTVVKYYEIQGYKDKVALAQAKLNDMEKDVFELINPRIGNEPKRIVPDGNLVGGLRRWRAWRAT